MGEDFIKDRSEYKGRQINPEAMEKARPALLSAFRSHMVSWIAGGRAIANVFDQAVVETQLAARTSDTYFILNSPTPTYLDVRPSLLARNPTNILHSSPFTSSSPGSPNLAPPTPSSLPPNSLSFAAG